jgi:hypothetical protein
LRKTEFKVKYFNLNPLSKLNQRQAVLATLGFFCMIEKYATKVSYSFLFDKIIFCNNGQD